MQISYTPRGASAPKLSSLLLTILVFLLALFTSQLAVGQVVFTELAASPSGGNVDAGGTLKVALAGKAQAASGMDSVNQVALFEISAQGETLLGNNFFTVAYSPRTGNPINTVRSISISALLGVGTHKLLLRGSTEGGAVSDSDVFTINVTPRANSAIVVAQSVVPTKVFKRQKFQVSVTVKNTGTNTWTPGGDNAYRLGGLTDAWTWGFNRVELDAPVAPGESHTFTLDATAPSTAGLYAFEWQMLQELVERFGSPTTKIDIEVENPANAAYVTQDVPLTMEPGKSYDVSVTMKNVGTTPWASGGPASESIVLGSQTADNTTWIDSGRVHLSSIVQPGNTTDIRFTVTAPRAVGQYNFQWRMVQGSDEWFGSPTENRVVNVVSATPVAWITDPPEGYTAWGGTTVSVPFAGEVTPSSGAILRAVQFLADGVVFASGAGTKINGSAALSVGTHSIELRVTDSSGKTSSAFRTVNVASKGSTAAFYYPTNGATYTTSGLVAMVPVSVHFLTQGTGGIVDHYNLYIDGVLKLTSGTSAPTTLAIPVGYHELGVEAFDQFGLGGGRHNINVTVVSTGGPPTVTLNHPGSGAYFTTDYSVAGVSVEAVGVPAPSAVIGQMKLYVDGVLYATISGATLNAPTVSLGLGDHTLEVEATDSQGRTGPRASATVHVSSSAAKPAKFSDLTVSPISGTADSTGLLQVSISGTAQPATWETSISEIQIVEGAIATRAALYRRTENADGTPDDSPRLFSTTLGLGVGTHKLVVRAITGLGAVDSPPFTITVAPQSAVTLSATPTNFHVSGSESKTVTFTGRATAHGGTLTKLELFRDRGLGFEATPVVSIAGSGSMKDFAYSLNLGAGGYRFKLGATDSTGVKTESGQVGIYVSNSPLLGVVSGVRTNTAGKPELYGWACQIGSGDPLSYVVSLDSPASDPFATVRLANLTSEPDNASVQATCKTPGAGHHFVVDLSTYVEAYAGRTLYVQILGTDTFDGFVLPCADNACTVPGTLRVGLTQPLSGDQVKAPNPVFMRMQLTDPSGPFDDTFDEIGFLVDGQWVPATHDAALGAYSGFQSSLVARPAPYTVFAVVRKGNMTLQSAATQFTVVPESATTVTITAPANGSVLGLGAQMLTVTVAGSASSVRFFVNGTQLAGTVSGSGSTWTQSWTPPAGGTYTLIARAYNSSLTEIGTSPPIIVTASDTSSPLTPTPVALDVPHLGDPDAGTLPGDLSVTAQGAATYTIPIVVPPGTAGVQPALALIYNSAGTNGLLGLGWTLSGLSSIHRCGQTIAQDGTNARIAFTTSDRLCLDGQRLVLVNAAMTDANYWAAGAEYRTEIDSFVRVKAAGAMASRTFTVEGKDGRVASYGAGSAAVAAIVTPYSGGATPPAAAVREDAQSWAIDSIRDRSGNFVTFEYAQDGATGEHRPTVVRYGGNGLKPHGAVAFVYEARPDAWKRYIDETRNDLRSRLSKIRTYIGDDLSGPPGSPGSMQVREYTLTYEQSPTSGRSLLYSVGACARNGTAAAMECQPATVFAWGKPDKAPGFVEWGTWSGTPLLTKNSSTAGEMHAEYFAFADFENHGRTDALEKRVAPPFRAPGSTKPVTTIDGLTVGTMRNQYRYFHNNGSGFTQYNYQLNTGVAFAVLDVADFNGDGAPDLVAATATGTQVCLSPLGAGAPASTAAPLVFTCSSSYLISGAANADDHPAYLVDVVGDGRSGQYSRIESNGVAKLCVQATCYDDDHPPAVLMPNYANDGSREYALANYVAFTQMVDFSGIGKSYDVRFSNPHYTEFTYDDGGTTKVYVNRWDNLRPTITMTGFNMPIPTGLPAPSDPPGTMAKYSYPTEYASPPPKVARAPYVFDKPYPGAASSADFSGSGYSGLAFGFVELGYDATGSTYNRAELTLCQSTGRGLDCGVRKKYSGDNYKAVVNIADFVGDGAPAILVQKVTFDAQKHATNTGELEMCRVMGDDTTDGTGTADSNMVCAALGMNLYLDGSGRATSDAYFMDLLGTGRIQLIYYHGGYTGTDGLWHEDGRWTVYQPIDRAAPGQALDRIHSVTNGVGAVSSVEYADSLGTAANDAIVTRTGDTDLAATYPQHLALRTGKIVKQLRVANGEGRQRTKSYSYADPAIDVAGRGALGFGTVTETDENTGLVTKTRYSHRWPHTAMVRSVQTVAGQTLLSDTTNTLSMKNLAHGAGAASVFPYIGQSKVDRWDLGGTEYPLGSVTTVNHYDDEYGNLTAQEVTSAAAGKTFQTQTVTSYRNDMASWLIGLPETISVTKTDPDFVNIDGSHAVTRHVHNFYDAATGLLSKTITEEGNPQFQVQVDFIRTGNGFGLVNERKESWYDLQASRTASRSQKLRYDSRGRYPETSTNALGYSEISTYDPANGGRTLLKDANLLTTTWTLNGFGRATVETRPGGNETRNYVKLCMGACRLGASLVQITEHFNGTARTAVPTLIYTDEVGHTLSTQSFDFAGRDVYADQFNDELGLPQRLNQPAHEGVTSKMAWRQEYDALGRVIKRVVLDESGTERVTTTSYQGLARVLTDPLSHGRTEVRNALGQLVSVTDAKNGVTSLAYEPFGNLRKTIDPSGNVSEVTYDVRGHRTKLKDPDLGEILYTPDQFGRPLVRQTAEQAYRGDRTDMAYDMLDRMIGRYERDLRSEWLYDTAANGKGQLAEAHTGAASPWDYRRVHTYDNVGRPSAISTTLSDGVYTSTPGYDAWGRVVSQTYRRGSDVAKTFGLRYNAFGYLATVERGPLVLWRVTGQDAAGRTTNVAFGNGLAQTRIYSETSGRLTGAQLVSGNLLRLDEGYQYDPIGNVKMRSQQWNGHGFIEMFTYDELNRLTTSAIGSDTKTINYYSDGRIRSKTGVGSGDYVYPVLGAPNVPAHAVSNIPGIGDFHYDRNGNLWDGNGRTVTWTSFDMPMKITKGSYWNLFVYGPEYQRVRQDRGDGTQVIYAGAQEVEKAGAQVTVKTYWPNGVGVEIDRPGKPTELSWTHTDRLGSPVALTDEAGNVREELAYDAWGKRRNTLDNTTQDTVVGNSDNKGFTSHEMLDQLGLVHMNGRVYDPLIGRFISGDPFVQDPTNGQNYNRYTYVLNNPTNLTDPTGFECEGGSAAGDACVAKGPNLVKCSGDCEGSGDAKKGDDTGKGSATDNAGNNKPSAKNPGAPNSASANSGRSKPAYDPSLPRVVVSAKDQGTSGGGQRTVDISYWLDRLTPGPLVMQGAKGALKMGLGGASVASGTGLCATGVGCLAGGPVAAIGASEATQGTTMLWDALHGVNSDGFNPLKAASNAAFGQYGDAVYDTAALASSVGALAAKVPLVLGPTDGIDRAKSIFGVTVSQWDNAKYIPALGLYLPPVVNQLNSVFSSSMKIQTIEHDLQKANH